MTIKNYFTLDLFLLSVMIGDLFLFKKLHNNFHQILHNLLIIFTVIIYPIIYLKILNIIDRKSTFVFMIFQLLFLPSLVLIGFSANQIIPKYYLIVFIILHIFQNKLLKFQVLISYLGYSYLIFQSFIITIEIIENLILKIIFFSFFLILIYIFSKLILKKIYLFNINKVFYLYFAHILIYVLCYIDIKNLKW